MGKVLLPHSDGPRVARFAEKFIRQSKGRWAGQPLLLESWQRELIDELFLIGVDGNLVYREALVGVPRKNGKSTLAAALGLYGLLGMGESGAEVYSAAASRDQARVVFDQAKSFVEASPLLSQWLRPMRNAIVCEETGGVYRVLSADAALQHGLNPSMVIIDELHAHRDPELYYALTTGQLARDNPLVVSITTAGYDESSICRQVYDYGKGLADDGLAAMRDAGFLFRWWCAPDDVDIEDRSSWDVANPSSWIAAADLENEYRRLPEHVFRRLHLNQWTAADTAWLPTGAWDACKEDGVEIPDGAENVYLGVDIGLKKDSTAVVACWRRDDGVIVSSSKIFVPPEGSTLELSVVEQYVRDCALKWSLDGVVYDRYSFERSAQLLGDEGLLMIEFPMTNERTVPASTRLYEAIKDGRVAHNGDRDFKAHVEAASPKETERGWRLSKARAKKKIDAVIALMIAFQICDQANDQKSYISII